MCEFNIKSIEKLKIDRNDIVIIKIPVKLSSKAIDRLKKEIQLSFRGYENKVVIMDESISVETRLKDEFSAS